MNEHTHPVISITIATFNRRDLLEKVLRSLINQTLHWSMFEVIICDSGSTDGTEELVQEVSKSTKISIKHFHTENILAAKRNLGIRHATSNFVIFLDDDCVPELDFAEKYSEIAVNEKAERRAVYCGTVRFPQEWCNSSNYYRFRDSRHPQFATNPNPVEMKFFHIVVMNMGFFKKEFIECIGSVDESFRGYGCEDTELGWRLFKNKFKIYFVEPKIIHNEPSGNVSGFLIKINRASRDGMKNLIERSPKAAEFLNFLQYADSEYPGVRSSFAVAVYKVLFFLSSTAIPGYVAFLLERTDRISAFYFPGAYKFLMAIEHLRGSLERSSKRVTASANWYD